MRERDRDRRRVREGKAWITQTSLAFIHSPTQPPNPSTHSLGQALRTHPQTYPVQKDADHPYTSFPFAY